ncbi:TerC family protein [Ramlibacter tataouinensis]|uniref:TerC family protein n=1 Tax=Ramlibacter tataouinensis TaxID=94132 RepID=UPI0022F38ED4|nr:TerC family protein [Ramlibacter tataouinensis]WBY00449.1 TerC family protein [Ramlibacter tataouinensis]
MALLTSPEFWIALMQIIMINIVLSGDNAVVIALACRDLPAHQQKKAILFGSVGAIVLRLVLTFFAVYLLTLPYLKLLGAVLLLWIGVGLLKGDDEGDELAGNSNLVGAIKTIVVADLVMSLDNVIGVAAAAKGDVLLLVVGLVISIPLIIFGSTLILKLMTRFPVIVTIGAGLLGWVAGEMALTDPAINVWAKQQHTLHLVAPVAGALLVIAAGKYLARLSAQQALDGGRRPAG